MQLGSMSICNCNIAVHVSDAFCVHLQEHLETVEAASGNCNCNCNLFAVHKSKLGFSPVDIDFVTYMPSNIIYT